MCLQECLILIGHNDPSCNYRWCDGGERDWPIVFCFIFISLKTWTMDALCHSVCIFPVSYSMFGKAVMRVEI